MPAILGVTPLVCGVSAGRAGQQNPFAVEYTEVTKVLKSSIGVACATVLVALAGGLVTPTASHAAVYAGVFDPENANYKWFGNHVFSVDDACLVGDGWKEVNSNTGYGCGSARLVGGDLTVVNKFGTPSLLDDVSRTLQFTNFGFIPTSINPLNTPIWGVNIVGGELAGIDTLEIGDFTFLPTTTTLTHGGNWKLRWSSGQGLRCTLYDLSSCSLPAPPITGPRVFLTNTLDGDPNAVLESTGPALLVSFQRIPEPGTAALVLAAMGAGWLARRRKR